MQQHENQPNGYGLMQAQKKFKERDEEDGEEEKDSNQTQQKKQMKKKQMANQPTTFNKLKETTSTQSTPTTNFVT
jgi:hypothetical protein